MISVDPVAERSPLGGLERWLDDPEITDVMVNGNGEVWIERGGMLVRVGAMSAGARAAAVERLLAPIGRRLDRTSPTVDARLADGARVCATIPPVSIDGLTLAVRRFSDTVRRLPAFASDDVASLLHRLVQVRANILVSGATGAGKTSLLAALASAAPPGERIVTLEDVAELRIDHPHVVRFESVPPSTDGGPAVTLDHLLRTALRMRPDRLVVGEARGGEVVTLLQAMNTGHDGSLATVHANSADDAIGRVRTLLLQHAPGWPLAAIDATICRGVDVVVHLARDGRGGRRVTEIREVGIEPCSPHRVLAEADQLCLPLGRVRC
jgi:pilus assembly protein CpaF